MFVSFRVRIIDSVCFAIGGIVIEILEGGLLGSGEFERHSEGIFRKAFVVYVESASVGAVFGLHFPDRGVIGP
jgi:hypothetical protein